MKTCILGILQGLTEFLPVSSSGHLVLAQEFLGLNQPGISFEIVLHLATLLAIIVYFNRELLEIFDFSKGIKNSLFFRIVIGSIPAAIVGMLADNFLEKFFEGTLWPSLFLILNGIVLFTTLLARERKNDISLRDAFLIGIAQAFAILPGISRSGSTITIALLLGIKRSEAFKFSFFLSIPAILGASILKLRSGIIFEKDLIYAFILAFVSGLIALLLLRKLVLRGKLAYFGIYTIILGVICLIISSSLR